VGTPWVAYAVPAAIAELIDPASVIPSSNSCPPSRDEYGVNVSASTESNPVPAGS